MLFNQPVCSSISRFPLHILPLSLSLPRPLGPPTNAAPFSPTASIPQWRRCAVNSKACSGGDVLSTAKPAVLSYSLITSLSPFPPLLPSSTIIPRRHQGVDVLLTAKPTVLTHSLLPPPLPPPLPPLSHQYATTAPRSGCAASSKACSSDSLSAPSPSPPTPLSQPIFHDGTKEWMCCHKRSHDFSLFLSIPGCKRGKHTTEKPKPITPAAPAPAPPTPSPVRAAGAPAEAATATTAPSAAASSVQQQAACNRCSQGFFCSDHSAPQASSAAAPPQPSRPPSWDINAERTCSNKGCGTKYREIDNSDSACKHHPGPAVFHDRKRGVR
ncbi:unnamed protein product [Closterium sp. NIES-64]|nr:unnamed protein product [Closterium sp. NIES-64]